MINHLSHFWTGKDGEFCVAKAQNSLVFTLIFAKLLVSGVAIGGYVFQTVTLEILQPYLVLLGATTTGYVWRSGTKARHTG